MENNWVCERNLVNVIVFALRGNLGFGNFLIRDRGRLEWEAFKAEFFTRFTNHGEIDEAMARVLSGTEVKTYEVLIR